jgi:hypothetical protein
VRFFLPVATLQNPEVVQGIMWPDVLVQFSSSLKATVPLDQGRTLMASLHPNHFPKNLPLNTIAELSLHPLPTSRLGLFQRECWWGWSNQSNLSYLICNVGWLSLCAS